MRAFAHAMSIGCQNNGTRHLLAPLVMLIALLACSLVAHATPQQRVLDEILYQWAENGNGGRNSITLQESRIDQLGTVDTLEAFNTATSERSRAAIGCFKFNQASDLRGVGLGIFHQDYHVCIAEVLHPDGKRLKHIQRDHDKVAVLHRWLDGMSFTPHREPDIAAASADYRAFTIRQPVAVERAFRNKSEVDVDVTQRYGYKLATYMERRPHPECASFASRIRTMASSDHPAKDRLSEIDRLIDRAPYLCF